MELEKVLSTRRSIRKYLKKPVEQEKITKIIESGLIAPSAHNRQPWKFAILDNSKEKIADSMDQYIETHKENKTIKHSANIIQNASNLILVFNVSEIKNDSDLLSIGGRLEKMLLEATNLGVQSLEIRDYIPVKEKINSLLNIPKEKHLESIIALGYSDQTPAYLPRKTYQQAVIYEENLDA